MNKFIIGIGVLAAIVIGLIFFGSSTAEYVAAVDNEVTQLENELASLEVAITAGTLSPETAAEARTKIITRIASIDAAIASSNSPKLTDVQRQTLIQGLDRLKDVLLKYKDTLVTVEQVAAPIVKRKGGKNSNTTIATIVADTIENNEQRVEDIIEDITDEEIIDQVAEDLADDEVEDDTASTTDEISEDGSDTIGDDEGTVVDDTIQPDDSETIEESDTSTTSEVETNESETGNNTKVESETTTN